MPQRGSRGGGAADPPSTSSDLTPAELADRTAIRQLEQIAPTITIKATPETVSFADQRAEQTCAINDKAAAIDMGDARITLKCRWDKQQLRQEFETARNKLIRTWGVDDSGHLVLKAHLEGIGQNTLEAKAVFDRS